MNTSPEINIIVDVERLKYPNSGMYYYCDHLYQNLINEGKYAFTFYKHKETTLVKGAKFINIKFWDVLLLKPKSKYKLWHTTNQLASRIPLKPIKLVFTIHDINFLYSNKPDWKKKREINKMQRKINRADFLTFISNFTYLDVKKHLNIEGKKYRIIYNGVTLKKFPLFDKPKYIPESKFLFTLGVVTTKKNFHTCIALLKNTDYLLVISGMNTDENYKNKIIDEAKKNGVAERVILTGPISEEEKYWYLNHCDAFIFPSLSEGFGIPPIEAMLLGKPTFLSNLTSLPEIGGEHAYYFKNFEENHMQKVFLEGMQDYSKNNRKESIINWANQFSWKKATQEYLEVYQETLTS